MPNGIVSAAQARLLGEITRQSGRNVADVTTRQQVQLRWLTIEGVPEVMARLEAAGLTSLQTGMDNIRGIVGCPVTGLTAARAVRHRAASPREFQRPSWATRPSPTCRASSTSPSPAAPSTARGGETQDIAMTPAWAAGTAGRRPGSTWRWAASRAPAGRLRPRARCLRAPGGGGGGLRGHRAALPRPRAARVAEQVAAGLPRGRVGGPRFRAALEARLGRELPPAGPRRARAAPPTDHIGIFRQRRPGSATWGSRPRWAASPATSSWSWRGWPRRMAAASSA